MKILILGASGLIGQALVQYLTEQSHDISVAGRSLAKLNAIFPIIKQKLIWDQLPSYPLNEFDAIINLAGENIAAHKWNQETKKRILESRIDTTKQLANWCAKWQAKAPRLLNASAIGIYGLSPLSSNYTASSSIYDENTPLPEPASDFLAQVAKQWENALQSAEMANVSVIKLRFAVVLSVKGGALAKMLPAFRLGMGSVLGTGQQPFSWISLTDVIRAIAFLLEDPQAVGPYNLVAPEIVTQRQFAKTLAKELKRPCFLTLPSSMVKFLFGQMGEELLLRGQAVKSQRLDQLGFKFKYSDLASCLAAEVAKSSAP